MPHDRHTDLPYVRIHKRYSRRADHAYGIQLNESMDGLSEKEYTFVLDVIKAMRQQLK